MEEETHRLDKKIKIEWDEMNIVKEEIDIDWDEKHNIHEATFDDCKKEPRNPVVVLERLSKSTIRKYVAVNKESELTKKCPKCKKLCKIQSFRWHVFYCGKERNLQCAHCSYKTRYKRSLIAHIPQVHPDGSETRSTGKPKLRKYCGKCDRSSEALSITSCEQCYSKLLFQCPDCKETFAARTSAYYHWNTRCGVRGYYHCHSCDYKTAYRSRVSHHVKSIHPSSDPNQTIQWKGLFDDGASEVSSLYACSKCAKRMETGHKLKMHMIFCKGDANNENAVVGQIISDPNTCSVCHETFEHVATLNRHIRTCTKNNYATRITNDIDDEIIDVVNDNPAVTLILADNVRKHIKEKAVRYCDKCMEESEIQESYGLSRKVQCCKCKTTSMFKCKKCLKVFRHARNIIIHLKSVCFPSEEYKCTECDYKATNIFRVRQHYKAIHMTVGKTKCETCGKKVKFMYQHKLHCGLEPKFQCDLCPFKTKLKMHMQNHIVRNHMEPKVINRSQSLKKAKQRFSRAFIHLEAYCGKCKKKQSLTNRLKTCENCKAKLRFKCKTCKRNYVVDDENACRHVKDYLETIKFECKLCGRGAISKASSTMHKVRCGAIFRCRFCGYSSNVKGRTSKHEKSKHPDRLQS